MPAQGLIPYLAKQLRVDRFRWITVSSVFLMIGSILGVLTYSWASNYEKERASILFGEYLSGQESLLQAELFDIAEELFHLRSLFDLEHEVSRAEFQAFAKEVRSRHPAISACEWAPRVTIDQREVHERQARNQGLEGYQICVRLSDNRIAPAPPQAEYYPVFYVEPLEANERALGFDVSSEKIRRAALIRAKETQKLSLTDPIVLVQETDSSKAFLAFLPIYSHANPEVQSERTMLEGFVILVLRSEDLLAKLSLRRQTDGLARMRFQLVDEEADGKPMVIEESHDWGKEQVLEAQNWVRPIEVGGQQWRLIGQPTKKFLSEHLTHQPWVLGVAAFLLWVTLGGLLLSVAERSNGIAQREQNRIVSAALNSLTEGLIVADLQGRFLLFNKAAEKILGMGSMNVSPSEWSATYGSYLPDTKTPYPPDQLPLARAMRGEVVREAEVYIRNPNVSTGVWLSINAAPLKDDRGALCGGVIVFRDISTRKKAEEDLRKSLKQLEDMKYALDQSSIVSIADHQGAITYANDKFCEISKYSREELLGQNHRIVNSGYHPRAFFQDMWKTIAKGEVWRGVIRNRAKDGTDYWADTTIVPFLDGQGKPERYLAIRSDVTETKRNEDALRRLSNAVEQTADTVFITNRDGVIEYVNPAFETTTGFCREEVLGKTPRILKSGAHDSKYYESLWKTILAGEVHRATTINRKKDGELYHAEQTVTPIKDSEGQVTHFVSVVKDVTERIKREEREIEMQYAAKVQQKLYPGHPPRLEGFDIAGAVFPAEATGGDYFDYLRMPSEAVGIAIGDVCGHGLGSALIMAETRAYLRSLTRSCSDPGQIFSRINQSLYEDLEDNRYVTLMLACIDAPNRRLVYASAGHPPGYLLDRAGAIKAVLNSTGFPLGMFPDALYTSSQSLALHRGDLVVFLTDGITESASSNGDFLEAEGVLEVIRAHRQEPAQQIVKHVQQAVRSFANGVAQADDLTIVICKVESLV